jgi:catechol 2,3-dioxygenase-like lactoylglutathione lyase family enzyme
MIHHLSFGVSDIKLSARFYDSCLGVLGYARVWEDLGAGKLGQAVGFGRPGEDDVFALKLRLGEARCAVPGFHVAFSAADQVAVQQFHAAAILNGGRDNGRPGLRLEYGPEYYAAFVIDPDGYRIEAVVDSRRGSISAW